MSYGITASGFIRKPKTIIREEQVALFRSKLGANIDLSPSTYEGQSVDITTENIDQIWQDLENQYYSVYTKTASGTQLDRLGSASGIIRRPQVKASVPLLFTGVDTTIIPLGFLVQTANGIEFATTEEKVISGNTFVNTSAVTAGITGNVSENSIVEIINPTTGIETVNNPLPSYGGSEIETDTDYRYRIIEIGISGKTSIQKIKQKIDSLEGVSSSKVYENNSAYTVNGLPPAKIEVIVAGGLRDEIGNAIYEYKAGGIQAVSNCVANFNNALLVKYKQKGECFVVMRIIKNGSMSTFISSGSGLPDDPLYFELTMATTSTYTNVKAFIDAHLSQYFSCEVLDSIPIISERKDFEPDAENSYTFIDSFGDSQTIQFSRPTIVYVNVIVRIKKNSNWISTNENLVIENIVKSIGGNYNGIQYAGSGVGESIREWKLISVNSNVIGIDDIDCLMAFSPVTPISNAILEIANNEIANILQNNVVIEYV